MSISFATDQGTSAAGRATDAPTLTLVVPVKDEEKAIGPFVAEVAPLLDRLLPSEGPPTWEILFVDDGSEDSTLAAIQLANARDRRVHGISLSRNFGKEAALTAGLDFAAGAAVVLGGETYDLESKTVVPKQARWLTIACAGSAAAKMRLLNYGPQSDFDGLGHPATVSQRQATLKMLTADYCGTGTSYTANGTPLQYEDAEGTVTFSGTRGAVESVWTAQGALCLDTTRIAGPTVACSRPSCANFDITDGVWASYVPTP